MRQVRQSAARLVRDLDWLWRDVLELRHPREVNVLDKDGEGKDGDVHRSEEKSVAWARRWKGAER